MASLGYIYYGPGPHTMYHSLGQDIVVGVYDALTFERIENATVKVSYSSVEVTLPTGSNYNSIRIVAVG